MSWKGSLHTAKPFLLSYLISKITDMPTDGLYLLPKCPYIMS